MKNTLIRVWGIVLTLAILSGMLMASVPVAGANLAFSAKPVPSTLNNFLVNAAAPITWVTAVSADGTTVLAWDDTNNVMYRSTNSGATFAVAAATGLPAAALNSMKFSPDAGIVIVNDGTTLYGSTNGGVTFGVIALPAGWTGPILSTDVTNGPTILLGEAGNAYIFRTTGLFGSGWTSFNKVPAVPTNLVAADNVIGIAFSPTYITDNLIFMVVDNGATIRMKTVFGPRAIGIDFEDRVWAATGATSALFTFPGDFSASANPNMLISLNGGVAGIHRVGLVPWSNGAGVAGIPLLTATVPTSMTFSGTWAAGTAYITSAGSVSRCTGVTAVGAAFVPASNVSGNANYVAAPMIDTNIYVMSGAAGGAFQRSADQGAIFYGVSLIQADSLVGTALRVVNYTLVDANNWFLVARDNAAAASAHSILKSTNAGASWIRVRYSPAAGEQLAKVYASPAYMSGPDNTIYVTITASNKIYRSTNGGMTFSAMLTQAAAVGAFAVVDTSNYFYTNAGTGAIYRTNAFTPVNAPAAIFSITYVNPTLMFLGGTAGQVWKSVDNGATFTAVTTGLAAGNIIVAANAAGALYCASDVAGVGVRNLAGAPVPAPGATATTTDLALGFNGAVYAVDSTNNLTLRYVTGAAWEVLATGWTAATTSNLVVFNTGTAAAPVNTIYSISNLGNAIADYTDTINAAPAVVSPAADGLVAANNFSVSWNAVPGATAYTSNIHNNAGLIAPAVASGVGTPLTSAFVAGLANGMQYYFTVQVTAPLLSRVSAAVPFQTKLTVPGANISAVGNMAPAPGSSTTNTSPTFNWAAVANATSYDIVISSKADFSSIVDVVFDLTNTVYTTAKKLDPGVYYWQVRAVNATNKGDWVQSTFTVAAPVAVTTAPPVTMTAAAPIVTVVNPTPIVTVPQATVIVPTPTFTQVGVDTGTPSWAWIVIAIGAVLLIAVIVLIVRTRRV